MELRITIQTPVNAGRNWANISGKTANAFLAQKHGIGDREAFLKLFAVNANNARDACSAIGRLEKAGDFEAIASIAGWARMSETSVFALKALDRNGKSDMIVNAVFTTSMPPVVIHGVRMLVEDGMVEELQKAGMHYGYGKDLFEPIAIGLARVINGIIAKKDNMPELLRIASSRLSYLKANDAGGSGEGLERVKAAMEKRDKAALVSIAMEVEEEFLSLSGKVQGKQ